MTKIKGIYENTEIIIVDPEGSTVSLEGFGEKMIDIALRDSQILSQCP